MSILDDAKGVLERILKLMNFPATIEGKETDDMVLLTIASEDANIIIGQKGKNLDALQYIVNRIVHRGKEERKRVILDSEGYRDRRKATLENMARETAEIVRSTGKAIALEDLNARERWIIHTALKSEQGIKTESRGLGSMRKLVIIPSKGEEEPVDR